MKKGTRVNVKMKGNINPSNGFYVRKKGNHVFIAREWISGQVIEVGYPMDVIETIELA